MKKFANYMFIVLAVSAMVFNGCKDPEEEPNRYQVLADYLKATPTTLDLPAMHATGWNITATTLNTNLSTYYIIDLRSAADFALGRIQGSVNVPSLTTLLTQAASATKPICLVCYSGQTAAFAVAALRLSGYPNAVFLKWGMSAWTATRDVWTAKIGNIATTPANANWVTYSTTSFATNVEYTTTPKITSTKTAGVDILKERVAAVLAEGAKWVQAADVLGTPTNYFVNNYWLVANVTANGNAHIKGAFRINPLTLVANEFKFLDPSKKIVNYCWTGQTSAAVTFYLKVLGYDAYGLQWGCNAMNNAQLTSNKWPEGQQSFPLVTN